MRRPESEFRLTTAMAGARRLRAPVLVGAGCLFMVLATLRQHEPSIRQLNLIAFPFLE